MAKKPEAYWIERASQRLILSEATGKKAIVQALSLYNQAQQNIQNELKALYDAYSTDGILDVKELQKAIGESGAREFMRLVENKAKKLGLDPENIYDERYLSRLTRLQAIQEQVKLEAMSIAPQEEKLSTQAYSRVLQDAYSGAQADLDLVGIQPAFSTINKRVTEKILQSVWAGDNYSNRVWGNTEKLAARLPTIIGSALTIGQSYAKTAAEIQERFDVARYEAVRLVRTETNYFHNQAELQSYIDDGIEEYTLDVTLDGRTSSICLGKDESVVYLVSQAIPGVNYPPFHPNCRTVPRAVLASDAKRPTGSDRYDRFESFDEGTLKQKWKDAMQKQMNPNQAVHDYNADMNQLTQDLGNKVITKEQFQQKLNTLMTSIPLDNPLRPALEKIGKLYGWRPVEAFKDTTGSSQVVTPGRKIVVDDNVKKMFEEAGWDYEKANLDQAQVDFIKKAGIKFDPVGAEVSITNLGQYDNVDNTLSMADNRVRIAARTMHEPNLFEKVFKHELGHAFDDYAPQLDPAQGGRFSTSNEWDNLAQGNLFMDTMSKEAAAVIKARYSQGLTDLNAKRAVEAISTEDFIKQVESGGAVKVGNNQNLEVSMDQIFESVRTRELFAEAYSMYFTDPVVLQKEAPGMYKYLSNIVSKKL